MSFKNYSWIRTHSMSISDKSIETWYSAATKSKYKLNITYGKPVNILSLKSTVLKNFESQALHVRNTRNSLFKSSY